MSEPLAIRTKPVVCPSCGDTLHVNTTPKRERLIRAIASGKYDTLKAAAEAAGMHPVHASQTLADPAFALTVSNARQAHLDKARSADARAENLLSKALTALDGANLDDPVLAGSVAKLALDVQEKRLKIREMIGDDAGDAAQRAAREAWVGHLRRAVELAGGTWDDAIPERIESGADPQDVVDPR